MQKQNPEPTVSLTSEINLFAKKITILSNVTVIKLSALIHILIHQIENQNAEKNKVWGFT